MIVKSFIAAIITGGVVGLIIILFCDDAGPRRRHVVDLEMQNAALKSANEVLLRSARINHDPIYVGPLDRRDSQGGKRK